MLGLKLIQISKGGLRYLALLGLVTHMCVIIGSKNGLSLILWRAIVLDNNNFSPTVPKRKHKNRFFFKTQMLSLENLFVKSVESS